MAQQLVPETLNTAGARLPAAYEAARTALANCASVDECQTWASKAAALASYARQADDETLQKHALRIQSRAVRRCGELLKELRSQGARSDLIAATEMADGTARKSGDELRDGTVPKSPKEPPEGDLPKSASAAAREAGMSERQQKTAIRVANVPAAHFEAAVESDEPPTVTRLADMGRMTNAAADAPAPPGFQAQIQLMGHARRLAEFATVHDPAFVGQAVTDYNRRELRGHVARCRRFLNALAPLIRED
ncbi:hypothetical protein ACWGNZ_00765 [Sphingomonas zeae]